MRLKLSIIPMTTDSTRPADLGRMNFAVWSYFKSIFEAFKSLLSQYDHRDSVTTAVLILELIKSDKKESFGCFFTFVIRAPNFEQRILQTRSPSAPGFETSEWRRIKSIHKPLTLTLTCRNQSKGMYRNLFFDFFISSFFHRYRSQSTTFYFIWFFLYLSWPFSLFDCTQICICWNFY